MGEKVELKLKSKRADVRRHYRISLALASSIVHIRRFKTTWYYGTDDLSRSIVATSSTAMFVSVYVDSFSLPYTSCFLILLRLIADKIKYAVDRDKIIAYPWIV